MRLTKNEMWLLKTNLCEEGKHITQNSCVQRLPKQTALIHSF